jgi:CRISPR-associated exonuclease Cas4
MGEFCDLSSMLTVTNVVEHAFCARFTYFELVLDIRQREGMRGTVIAGKTFHSNHSKRNKRFQIKKLDGTKLTELFLKSNEHYISGKIDEAIELPDEIVIIERKYSDYAFIGSTIRTQMGLLAILVEENMEKKVNQGIVVFEKSKRVEIPFRITSKIKQYALFELEKTRQVIKRGVIPRALSDNRCLNCCYRRICPSGN